MRTAARRLGTALGATVLAFGLTATAASATELGTGIDLGVLDEATNGVNDDVNVGIDLGQLDDGVSPWEMADAGMNDTTGPTMSAADGTRG